MTLRNPDEAVKAALATKTNKVGMCQQVVRGWLGSDSVGDYDGDGRPDAEDGWKSEPSWAKHTDQKGRPGYPASFLGGRKDDGHRALFLEDGKLRSTDFDTATQRYKAGVVGTADNVNTLARAMGVTYAGWSDTIGGEKIPPAPAPKPTRLELFHAGKPRYNLRLLEGASDRSQRVDKHAIAGILEEIRAEVAKLPRDKDRSLVAIFVETYKEDKVLRMGLLRKAVNRGRMGRVRQVETRLQYLIDRLPKK